MPYFGWKLKQMIGGAQKANLQIADPKLAAHAQYAANKLQRSRLDVDSLMFKYKLALPDRQCAMAELSQRLQDLIVILVTATYAARQDDELIRASADIVCQDLRRKLTGARPSGKYFKDATQLGKKIAAGGFSLLDGIEELEIMQKYETA